MSISYVSKSVCMAMLPHAIPLLPLYSSAYMGTRVHVLRHLQTIYRIPLDSHSVFGMWRSYMWAVLSGEPSVAQALGFCGE